MITKEQQAVLIAGIEWVKFYNHPPYRAPEDYDIANLAQTAFPELNGLDIALESVPVARCVTWWQRCKQIRQDKSNERRMQHRRRG
jgi:hypothetical protein